MACQITPVAPFLNINVVKRHLFPKLQIDQSQEDLSGWDEEDWGWKIDEDEAQPDEDSHPGWLQDCCVSLSPTGELVALARESRLVVLEQRWDGSQEGEAQMKYSEVVNANLAMEEGPLDMVKYKANRADAQASNREIITSVLCLPLASHKRSTQGRPDCTCIVVGFSSGFVRIYTESGKLLLSQIFSEEPVGHMKCRTYEPPRHSADAEKHEELTILYKRALVTVDGFSLFQSLRACRNQVARAAASGSESVQPPPLAYKKWALQGQDHITDHVSCGIVTPNPFDQMQAASMLNGPNSSIKPTPPASHLYYTGGTEPYVGAFYAVEGSTQPMLSDVAHAVASKLKSALFSQISAASGWFGLGSRPGDNNKEKTRPKIEPATSLPMRFGLPDKLRAAQSVALSPDSKLLATTDSLARVILVDVERGIAVRMWKGYRDAQVGWMEVREDMHPERDPKLPQDPRHALFLIIYAPRRGILEVWTSQQGPRVAAFNVSKHCSLVCPGYGMMGLNIVTCHNVKVTMHQCFLIDPNQGIKTVDIPFHLALSDQNSKRARDLHLLKKLKICLKENTVESESLQNEVIAILLDMRIGNLKQQGVERVLHTRYLSSETLLAVLQTVSQQLQGQAAELAVPEDSCGQLDYESRMLQQFCAAEERLIHTYTAIAHINTQPLPEAPTVSSEKKQAVSKVLGVYGNELLALREQLDTNKAHDAAERHVRFEEEAELRVTDFLGCFECQLQREEGAVGGQADGEKTRTTLQVVIKSTLSESRYNKLGQFLIKPRLDGGLIAEFEAIMKKSGIPAENLLHLLLHMWLLEEGRSLEETHHLAEALLSVSNIKDAVEVIVDHNSLSPWWQTMRDSCAESENISGALLAALVGRSVANDMLIAARQQERGSVSSSDSNQLNLTDWESVTIDRTQWTVLVKQLEDLLVLQNLLRLRLPLAEDATSPGSYEQLTVSVKRVLDGGRRVMPELVAQWIACQAIPPSALCLVQEEEDEEAVEPGEEAMEGKRLEPQTPIVSQLQAVQRRLPHSLATDVLMANCAWEYGLQWNKDPETTFPLQQAVAYLKCIHNAVVQHGVASMMWRTFLQGKLEATFKLMNKVGKAPREYLCRRDVGLTNVALEKFLGLAVELIDTVTQSRHDVHEVPMFNVEDLWVCVQGPTALVELAVEQKETNEDLVAHHFLLCIIMQAIMVFSLKSIAPMNLFDSKGRNAFFKPLDSDPVMNCLMIEEAVRKARQEFLERVLTQTVVKLSDQPRQPVSRSNSLQSGSGSPSAESLQMSWVLKSPVYGHWSALVGRLAKELLVDEDALRRLHVVQLYSAGADKLAEEILLTVSDHMAMGKDLMQVAAQRLSHHVFVKEASSGIELLTKCSPTLSTWLKSTDPKGLLHPDVPLKDTAALIGQVVNQLPESHPDYRCAISLVELVQALL